VNCVVPSLRVHKVRLQLVQWLVVVEGQCEAVVGGACAGGKLSHSNPVASCFNHLWVRSCAILHM